MYFHLIKSANHVVVGSGTHKQTSFIKYTVHKVVVFCVTVLNYINVGTDPMSRRRPPKTRTLDSGGVVDCYRLVLALEKWRASRSAADVV